MEEIVNRIWYASLNRAENVLSKKHNGETAVVFNAQGRYVFSRTEPGTPIRFTDGEMALMRDAIVTHNHPAGTSFGDTDIATACNAQVREMRIVTSEYTFSMQPPKGGWSLELWHKTINPAPLDAEQMILSYLGDAVGEGRMTEAQYRFEYIDRTWEVVAQHTGIVYRKQRRV